MRRLGLEERGHQTRDQVGALATLARFEVQLQVAVPGGRGQRVDCRLGQRGAPQVGVQDHTGGVDDTPELRRRCKLESFLYAPRALGVGGCLALALGVDLLSDGRDHTLASVAGGQRRIGLLIDQSAYSRQGDSWLKLGTP